MNPPTSLFDAVLQEFSDLRPQVYFKPTLTALTQAMEDLVLSRDEQPLVILSLQREQQYRCSIRRYQQVGQRSYQTFVLAVPDDVTGFAIASDPCTTIPLNSEDALAREWHLLIVSRRYVAGAICRASTTSDLGDEFDWSERYESVWTFDAAIVTWAARWMLDRILILRPELAERVAAAKRDYRLAATAARPRRSHARQTDASAFASRLVTYLQASQYQLLKAYRRIEDQGRNERLILSISTAMRRSLQPEDVLATVVRELGRTFAPCRCILYRCEAGARSAEVTFEDVADELPPLLGEPWPLSDNPLVQVAQAQERAIAVTDVRYTPSLNQSETLQALCDRWQITTWLLAPIRHQGELLGTIEIHHAGASPYIWADTDVALVEAIATQVGIALTQAQAFAELESLTQRLQHVDRAQRNLIAIVGHELRTPLSTIRICLESLTDEPDMPAAMQTAMLETASGDAERMRRLVQDFLTLSKLESGQVRWQIEETALQPCVDLALSGLSRQYESERIPAIDIDLPHNLPNVLVDADMLVELLSKLLDNAAKFTPESGAIDIRASLAPTPAAAGAIEVVVADSGRGITDTQLDSIFDRFAQEEGAMQRSAGGVGLGLAICRRIVEEMGGEIWAESPGVDGGSEFHFTLPVVGDLSSFRTDELAG